MLTANVVVVDVDAVRRRRRQKLSRKALVVVEGSIEGELVADVANLCCGAGAADDTRCAAQLGDLAGETADRAGGARDEDDVSGFQRRDLEHLSLIHISEPTNR